MPREVCTRKLQIAGFSLNSRNNDQVPKVKCSFLLSVWYPPEFPFFSAVRPRQSFFRHPIPRKRQSIKASSRSWKWRGVSKGNLRQILFLDTNKSVEEEEEPSSNRITQSTPTIPLCLSSYTHSQLWQALLLMDRFSVCIAIMRRQLADYMRERDTTRRKVTGENHQRMPRPKPPTTDVWSKLCLLHSAVAIRPEIWLIIPHRITCQQQTD